MADDEPAEPDEAPAEIAGDADPADVRVIDEWAKTLASGDVEGAAELFAIPSVAENGILIEIEDENDALRFNASLPCGAELIGAESQGEFTTATFRLIERPGAGRLRRRHGRNGADLVRDRGLQDRRVAPGRPARGGAIRSGDIDFPLREGRAH